MKPQSKLAKKCDTKCPCYDPDDEDAKIIQEKLTRSREEYEKGKEKIWEEHKARYPDHFKGPGKLNEEL